MSDLLPRGYVPPKPPLFTEAEQAVLKAMKKLPNPVAEEIASHLGIERQTVNWHFMNIYRKLKFPKGNQHTKLLLMVLKGEVDIG